MIAVNLIARGSVKRQLLTYGDVIVASASDPELRIQGECMVNSNDSFRRSVSHACHKHCTDKEESKTGDELKHCQRCKKWNSVNNFSNQIQPTVATKLKKALISNLGNTALIQMLLLMFCSLVLVTASIITAVHFRSQYQSNQFMCATDPLRTDCELSGVDHFSKLSGGFGGFNKSMEIFALPPNGLTNELISFCISNGAQFIYSLLHLMMIYNITLVYQERDWGQLEHFRHRIRCTIVKGEGFSQNYLLQLPKKILFPVMAYSVLTHWMLGEALQAQETIWLEDSKGPNVLSSRYSIMFAAYPLWCATALIILMTGVCWWTFTYKREGFIPQMFGSIRTLCAATTELNDFPSNGIMWGDLGMGTQFRHAGLSSEGVNSIVPNELYAGGKSIGEENDCDGYSREVHGTVKRTAFDSRYPD
ncbi:hypothetical protein BU24DRAFT_478909 [Aaosphaeria arxii CBS 175.79]|uniref:Uncharacterized protein n=1 Tax=Aaosphaeria arxii CBS 175.79 TaxID=1450172 RepID=A0A6A5XZP1_9PLEO|nr:uncharacterized protein BU24DRAFT_478909 [Aaosphaeria arxii CBS 175.79]KAF2017754.1 hypothetical protein BU24DRAFT_478909 [Aaosphaeria arxii CBS 175.79]